MSRLPLSPNNQHTFILLPSVCLSLLVCMVEITYVHINMVFGFHGYRYFFFFFFFFFYCLVGCLSMIVWTPALLGVLYACGLYFCIIIIILFYY